MTPLPTTLGTKIWVVLSDLDNPSYDVLVLTEDGWVSTTDPDDPFSVEDITEWQETL